MITADHDEPNKRKLSIGEITAMGIERTSFSYPLGQLLHKFQTAASRTYFCGTTVSNNNLFMKGNFVRMYKLLSC